MLRKNALLLVALFSIVIALVIPGCQPSASSYIESGNAYSDNKEYDRAIAEFDKAIEIDANSSAAYQ